jgi:hypothetical protein
MFGKPQLNVSIYDAKSKLRLGIAMYQSYKNINQFEHEKLKKCLYLIHENIFIFLRAVAIKKGIYKKTDVVKFRVLLDKISNCIFFADIAFSKQYLLRLHKLYYKAFDEEYDLYDQRRIFTSLDYVIDNIVPDIEKYLPEFKPLVEKAEILPTIDKNINSIYLQKEIDILQQQIARDIAVLFNKIYDKAEQDIKTVGKLPQYTVDSFNSTKSLAIEYSQSGFYWFYNNYDQIKNRTIKIIEPLRYELIKYHDNWFNKFNENAIEKVNQAERDFYLLKAKQEDKTPDKLVEFIIIESVKKSTYARIIDSGISEISNFIGIPNVWELNQSFEQIRQIRKTIFDQPGTFDLMLTMIAQIACAYEHDDLDSPERQTELMFIFMISFLCGVAIDSNYDMLRDVILDKIDINKLMEKIGIKYDENIVNKLQKGVDKVKNFNPLENFLLSIALNIVLFLVVGVIAKLIYQYYENPPEILTSMKLFNQIKNESNKSVLELIENTDIIEDIILECCEVEKIELEIA